MDRLSSRVVFTMFKVILVLMMAVFTINCSRNKPADLVCGMCRAVVEEINELINNADPSRTLDAGSFRIDPSGNVMSRKVLFKRSDTHLTSVLETVCQDMKNYGEFLDSSSGLRGFARIVRKDGRALDLTGFLVSDNVTNWLRMECEDFVDEHEDVMKRLFSEEISGTDAALQLCRDATQLCDAAHLDAAFEVKPLLAESASSPQEQIQLNEHMNGGGGSLAAENLVNPTPLEQTRQDL